MNILILGASGFVGGHLSRALLAEGHAVTGIGTSRNPVLASHEDFIWISADTTRPGPWQAAVPRADVIVNLAGRTIFKRWSRSYKKQLYDSRILTTRNLVAGLPPDSNAVFFSTSAAGYYGFRGDEVVTEDAAAGDDFLAATSVDWENEARLAARKGARVVLMRFGIVLAADGGALGKMAPAFKLFAGGPLGTGRQWFPWIHMADIIGAIGFLVDRDDLDGPFNFTAPEPVRNGRFAKLLGQVLKRPAVMPAPAFAIRLIMGEMGGAILNGQRAVPDRLKQAGYRFRFPDAGQALSDLYGRGD